MGSSIRLDDVGIKLESADAQYHKETVADLLQRQNLHFPGAQPVSFARKHLREIERTDYFVAEKTDGIRCLLFLTQTQDEHGEQREAQFLIDRKNDYYFIRTGYLHIPPPGRDRPYEISAWHLGTILDGELVRQKLSNGVEQMTYLIFDCLALDTNCVMGRDYGARLWKIKNLVYSPWKAFVKDWPQDGKAQPFQLSVKEPQMPYGIKMMFHDVIPQLPHGNDGLIFTCKDTAYVAGTDPHILKWKPPEENTIDFKLRLGAFPMAEDADGMYEDFDQKPEFELLVNHGHKDNRKFANLFLTDEEWEAMKGLNEMFDGRIIECYRDANTGNWRPKLDERTPRFRDDKNQANHISTVESVLESIEDAVSRQDLEDAAPAIRHNWKERERLQKERARKLKEQQQQQQQRQQMQQQPQQTQRTTPPGYED